ncbi:MAG: hypothetical protein GXY44_15145 [Phycisphaerales bacterium]|nr:hypothetical protein [Phycisphaerales bacterium]
MCSNKLMTIAAFVCMVTTATYAQTAQPVADSTQPSADTKPADSVAVTVEGHEIMESELDSLKDLFVRSNPQLRRMSPEQLEATLRPHLLRALIDLYLLDQVLEKDGVKATPEEMLVEVKKNIAMQIDRAGMTQEQAEQQIKMMSGQTWDEYIADQARHPLFVHSILLSKLMEKKYPERLDISDEDIEKEYEQSKEYDYMKVRASHILITTREMNTDEEKAAARKRIEELLVEARKPDADFAELARQNSDCPSKENGGDLNFFPRRARPGQGGMVEPFAEAAFALEPGQVSDVVETQFGYHIIKVTDKQFNTLADVKDKLGEQMKGQKTVQVGTEYLGELREAADIKYPAGKEPATRPAVRAMPKTTTKPATVDN